MRRSGQDARSLAVRNLAKNLEEDTMRWMKGFFKLLVVLLVAVVAATAFYAQSTLPKMDGRLQVTGLVGSVRVHRDASDVTCACNS